MKCPMCQAGLTSSCLGTSCESNQTSPLTESDPSPTSKESDEQQLDDDKSTRQSSRQNSSDDDDSSEGDEDYDDSDSIRGHSGRAASSRSSGGRNANLKDQQSTGRKRAAQLYPLDSERPCDWQGRSNCGGGSFPIIGCLSGKQQARHHGPDKNVTNNDQGNVHRICHYCHNRWHAANDPTYDWNATNFPQHSPQPMSDSDKEWAVMDFLRYSAKAKKVKITD